MVNIGELIAEGDTKSFLAFGSLILVGALQFIQGEVPSGILALCGMSLGYFFSRE